MKGFGRLIQDPLFVLDVKGNLLECNRHAEALLGAARPLSQHVFETDEAFRALMEAASGNSEPVIGAARLRPSVGDLRRFRVRAVVIDRSPELRVAVQILDAKDDQFALLSRRVKELNREIAERRSVQASLEESLARNEVLYRELQHRVKNHLQMMLGLFSAARRETSTPEGLDILQRMEAKLQVVFEAQRLMYADDARAVKADELLGAIARVLGALAGDDIRIDVVAEPIPIQHDVAYPVALILNELLSNAVKYGTPAGAGRILVSLCRTEGDLELQVRDWGPGFSESTSIRRSSGLGLVRGLCRQIGASIEFVSEGGTMIRVSFPHG